MSETLTADISGSMLAPLVNVEPTKPSPARTDTRRTLNEAAKRDVSSAASGMMNTYNSSTEHLGPVAPISVNFNHQLAYFTDQSDTTHVPHQPTAVA